MKFFKFHLAFLEIIKVDKNIKSSTSTMVAPLGIDIEKDKNNPIITLKIPKIEDKIQVFTKLIFKQIALITGIIISAPISKAPIIFMEMATSAPIRVVNSRFINFTFMPLEIAKSSLKEISNNF